MQLGAGGDASVLKGLDDFNLDLFDGDEFFEDDAAAADGINSFDFICGGGGDGPALFSGDGVTRAASGGDSAAGSSEKHPATSDDPKISTTTQQQQQQHRHFTRKASGASAAPVASPIAPATAVKGGRKGGGKKGKVATAAAGGGKKGKKVAATKRVRGTPSPRKAKVNDAKAAAAKTIKAIKAAGGAAAAADDDDDDEVNETDGELFFKLQDMARQRFVGGVGIPTFFVPQIRSEATRRRSEVAAARRKYRRMLITFQRRAKSLAAAESEPKTWYPERSSAAKSRKRVGGRFQPELKGVFRPVTEIQKGQYLPKAD
jgi:hypothetical protein